MKNFLLNFLLFAIGALFLILPPAEAEEPSTPLPIPRFVSLKSEEANLRSGPGKRYPILWVYHKEGMPMEVIEEYNEWRKVRDMEGSAGWLHKGLLSGARTAIIRNPKQIIRRSPSSSAAPAFAAAKNVLGKLSKCDRDWCNIKIDGNQGWVEKNAIWGAYPAEVF